MKGKLRERVTPLIISAMRMACCSLSITQGPAMRKSSPVAIRISATWKEPVICNHRGQPHDHQATSSFVYLVVHLTAVPHSPAGETFPLLLRPCRTAAAARAHKQPQ